MFKKATFALKTSTTLAGLVLLSTFGVVPGLPAPTASASDQLACTFAGKWVFNDGAPGSMTLDQTGNSVQGTSVAPDIGESQLAGTVSDAKLTGTWTRGHQRDTFLAAFTRWDTCDFLTIEWRDQGKWQTLVYKQEGSSPKPAASPQNRCFDFTGSWVSSDGEGASMSLRQTDTTLEGSAIENKVKTKLTGTASSGDAQGTWNEQFKKGQFRMTILPGDCKSMNFEKEFDQAWQSYVFHRADHGTAPKQDCGFVGKWSVDGHATSLVVTQPGEGRLRGESSDQTVYAGTLSGSGEDWQKVWTGEYTTTYYYQNGTKGHSTGTFSARITSSCQVLEMTRKDWKFGYFRLNS